jgi:hypothetical protein
MLDFVKEAMENISIDTNKIKENLSWLNSLLCDRKREVKTLEESILLLETILKQEERKR